MRRRVNKRHLCACRPCGSHGFNGSNRRGSNALENSMRSFKYFNDTITTFVPQMANISGFAGMGGWNLRQVTKLNLITIYNLLMDVVSCSIKGSLRYKPCLSGL
jgi:hypothetical protein